MEPIDVCRLVTTCQAALYAAVGSLSIMFFRSPLDNYAAAFRMFWHEPVRPVAVFAAASCAAASSN